MYIVKNALRNITRSKVRSVLIFILVLIISISACVALSIKSSADSTREDTLSSMSITATISYDRMSMMGGMSGSADMQDMMSMMSDGMEIEEYDLYATADSVVNYYYSASVSLSADEDDGIEAYSTSSTSSYGGGMTDIGGMSSMGGMGMESMTATGDFTVTGFSSHDAMTNFVDGTMTIIDGSMYDIDDEINSVAISQELAILNDLEVGDTFELYNPMNEDDVIAFTVCGIFSCESTDSFSNEIYISYVSLEKIVTASEEVATTIEIEDIGVEMTTELFITPSASYVLASPDDLTEFQTEVEVLGLDLDTYTVSSLDIAAYEEVLSPLESLSDFTLVFFLVVLGIGAVILIVFNLFIIRERKYEIGVLAAIGMPKHKVALQFLSEVAIITFAAVLVGSIIGTIAAYPIADVLLADQIEATASSASQISSNFGGNFSGMGMEMGMEMGESSSTMSSMMGGLLGFGDVDYVDSVTMSFSFLVVLELMAVGIFLSIISSSIGIISILRYEPLKILSERS